MNKEYVQQYVTLEKEHWWFVVRRKIIGQFLHRHIPKQSLHILNIGAAGGASTQWLSELGTVVSVESEPLFIDHLKSTGIDVIHASVLSMPFADDSFDLVCAFDVIEHVQDDTAAMKEMKRVCRPGGLICVTVPAFKLLWSDHDVVNGHYRRYTKSSLLYMADAFPFLKKVEIQYFNSLLFLPILTARKISNILENKKRTGSDFSYYKTSGLLNKLFKGIFSSELWLLKLIRFPFGVSLIAAWKKTVSNT